MSLTPIEEYYQSLVEPDKSCLLYIRDLILSSSPHFSEHWKWGGPFFYYKKKMLCYFWFDKKTKKPYISFGEGRYIHHPKLETGGRVRFKLLYIDTDKDIDVATINFLLDQSIQSMIERGHIK